VNARNRSNFSRREFLDLPPVVSLVLTSTIQGRARADIQGLPRSRFRACSAVVAAALGHDRRMPPTIQVVDDHAGFPRSAGGLLRLGGARGPGEGSRLADRIVDRSVGAGTRVIGEIPCVS